MKEKGTLDEGLCEELLSICCEYGLVKSYSVKEDKEGMNFLQKYENVSVNDICYEINSYFLKQKEGEE